MESLAQVGVQLLLFSLGLEFSLSKLRAVRSVALAGEVQCSQLLPLLTQHTPTALVSAQAGWWRFSCSWLLLGSWRTSSAPLCMRASLWAHWCACNQAYSCVSALCRQLRGLPPQVSMSSTSIVVKCLTDQKATNSPHGQITIGTLILQVSSCCKLLR